MEETIDVMVFEPLAFVAEDGSAMINPVSLRQNGNQRLKRSNFSTPGLLNFSASLDEVADVAQTTTVSTLGSSLALSASVGAPAAPAVSLMYFI